MPRPLQVWCDHFPVVSETFVTNEIAELVALGHDVVVVAGTRPADPAAGQLPAPVLHLSETTAREQLGALLQLVLRRPWRVLADLAARRRWAREEYVVPLRVLAPAILALEHQPRAHIHAHFAAGAALGALRASRISGRPWSLTAHAYDIYLLPRNLREKLGHAALVTSGCDYTVRDLRRLAGPAHADKIHRIVMGVDPERFRRRGPHPAQRVVVGVGRLVEKKGFIHLIRAVAELYPEDRVERLVLVGAGPLEQALRDEAARLGAAAIVEFAGRREAGEVRAILEEAAVLAMPCVVAADGDRDSMPVVVKEALAMEVPVVVTDEVGLPEIARPEFARVVPPGDHVALAGALGELLALSPEERAAMGRAGRDFVAEHANVAIETARLSSLLDTTG